MHDMSEAQGTPGAAPKNGRSHPSSRDSAAIACASSSKAVDKSQSLASEAYLTVRQRILRGELAIGQAISRRKVAAELGMSFLPVSEAFMRLEFEGLLEPGACRNSRPYSDP